MTRRLRLYAAAAWLSGCGPAEPAAAPTAEQPSAPLSADRVACMVHAVIEDGENGDNQVRLHDGRNGYIYTFGDDDKTTIVPPRGADFAMEAGGAIGSAYAIRVRGKVGEAGLVYGGVGLNLKDPRVPYDASKYQGISFLARRAPGTAASLRLKVPDASTDPDGKVCTECFNDFGADITVSEEWDRFVVPFDYMKQLSGWGSPRPATVDAARIYSIQFQVSEPGAAFDVWIDDVVFLGCEP